MLVPSSTTPPSTATWPPLADPVRPCSSIRFPESLMGPVSSEMTSRGDESAISASRRSMPPDRSGIAVVPPMRTSTFAEPSKPTPGTKAASTRSTATPVRLRFNAGDSPVTSTSPPNVSALPAASQTTSSMEITPFFTVMVDGRLCFTWMPEVSKLA